MSDNDLVAPIMSFNMGDSQENMNDMEMPSCSRAAVNNIKAPLGEGSPGPMYTYGEGQLFAIGRQVAKRMINSVDPERRLLMERLQLAGIYRDQLCRDTNKGMDLAKGPKPPAGADDANDPDKLNSTI